ncbi:MAG: membrane integrity-associated transporter subunit PqiC [Nitrospirales bacterium]
MKTLARNLALLTVITWLLSGCAGSPPVHYYTLSVEAETGLPSSVTDRTTLTLAVDPISLPDVVDRPQIVLQSGSNQVTLVDDHRWAESLKSEIPRIIAGNLSQLLLTKMVWAYPQHVKGPVDYRVFIDIQRFESTHGSSVAIDALWTIQRSSEDGADPKTGRSTVQQPITGQGYEAIAAAHSRALADISREIAEAIRHATERK